MKPNLVNIKMNIFYVIINYGTFYGYTLRFLFFFNVTLYATTLFCVFDITD